MLLVRIALSVEMLALAAVLGACGPTDVIALELALEGPTRATLRTRVREIRVPGAAGDWVPVFADDEGCVRVLSRIDGDSVELSVLVDHLAQILGGLRPLVCTPHDAADLQVAPRGELRVERGRTERAIAALTLMESGGDARLCFAEPGEDDDAETRPTVPNPPA